MIIPRQKLYSEKLKDSRIGIGWTQDGNSKVDAEKYFRVGKEAADKAAEEGKSDEEIIKAAKKAAGKEATLDKLSTGISVKDLKFGYTADKEMSDGGFDFRDFPKIDLDGDIKIPQNIKSSLGKNSKKIAMGAAVLGATSVIAKEAPKIIKKRKAARLGAEINTKERIKKSKKK